MFNVVLLTILASLLSGVILKLILDVRQSPLQITWREFAIGSAIIALVLAPLTSWIGWHIARQNNLTFNEYWNGWEVSAISTRTDCHRDSSCRWNYDCDPYLVPVSYPCNCDSKGSNCQTCTRYETRYHSCPYVTFETDFAVQTTLGNYAIATNRFPDNPRSHIWRSGESIPDYIISQAGVGQPPFWVEAKKRCDARAPGPATAVHTYDNYILASDTTILKQASSDIEHFKSLGLLPSLASGVGNFYHANKCYFIGSAPQNANEWQTAIEYFNARFGSELQGDLHLVLVRNEEISQNPDRYMLALKTYWQNKSVFGKNVLSKNGIVVLLGTTDGSRVAWVRAWSGMPVGNEGLVAALQNGFQNGPLNSGSIVGPTESKFEYVPIGNGGARKIIPTRPARFAPSILDRVIWGIDNPTTKFKRISMSGKDGKGGFLYLKDEIQLSSIQKGWIFGASLFFCFIVWVVLAFIGDPRFSSPRYGYRF